MRFSENRIDFYDGWAMVNGIIFDRFTKITCGIAEVNIWKNDIVLCSIPIDNINDTFYVAENDVISDIPVNETEISKWLQKEINLNLDQLSEAVGKYYNK